MGKVLVGKSDLNGTVRVPSFKNDAHRAIMCAIIAKGTSVISPVELSDDIHAIIGACGELGVKASLSNKTLTVENNGIIPGGRTAKINCGDFGMILRYLVPIISAFGFDANFFGSNHLEQGLINNHMEAIAAHGIVFSIKSSSSLSLQISGNLEPGEYIMPQETGSQFVSGLLFALPLLNGDSRIRIPDMNVNGQYIDMTVSTMEKFGVTVHKKKDGYLIRGNQTYKPVNYTVERDWSQASVYLAAAAMGGEISVEGMKRDSLQDEKVMEDILIQFGANISWCGEDTIRCGAGELKGGLKIDLTETPDLLPVVAVVAGLAKGKTKITGFRRQTRRDTDLINLLKYNLKRLGAGIKVSANEITITGVGEYKKVKVKGGGDPLMAESMVIASVGIGRRSSLEISGISILNKMYPEFYNHIRSLGGNIIVM